MVFLCELLVNAGALGTCLTLAERWPADSFNATCARVVGILNLLFWAIPAVCAVWSGWYRQPRLSGIMLLLASITLLVVIGCRSARLFAQRGQHHQP